MATMSVFVRNVTVHLLKCFVFVLVLSSSSAFSSEAGDSDSCILQGSVTDPDGRTVPGAAISLEIERGIPRRWRGGRGMPATISVITDQRGFYCFPDVKPGVYRMRVTAKGFKEETYTSVTLTAAGKKVIDVILSLAVREEVITVTATATRTAKLIESVPVRLEVVPRDVIKLSASRTLADAVEFTTGVRTENDCQNCNFSQVRLLGLLGNYTQILFDGQPTMSSVAMVYGIEQIPVAMIDRIEVVKGGGSALYGPSSVAGVINIIPATPSRSGGHFESRYEPMGGLPGFSLGGGADWVSAECEYLESFRSRRG